MAEIHCPKCASAYRLEDVGRLEAFTCGACSTVVNVAAARRAATQRPQMGVPVGPPAVAKPGIPVGAPTAARPGIPVGPAPAARPGVPVGPSTPRGPGQTAPARPARAAAPAAPARSAPAAPARAPARTAPVEPEQGDATRRPSSQMLVLGGIGVLAVVVVGLVVFATGGGGGDAPTAPSGAGGASASGAPKADPRKDPAAWKALSAPERQMLLSQVMAEVDPANQAAAQGWHRFLAEREENEAAASVARQVLEKDPESPWAHEAAGDVDVGPEVERCFRDCELSYEVGTDEIEELKERRKAFRDSHRSVWWADAKEAERIRELVAATRKSEADLEKPYWYGVARWVRWQRAIPIMQDYPAVHEATGPYLVFVSLNTPKGTPLKDVDPKEVARGREILARNVKLVGTFYEGWMETMGPILGLNRYGPDNSDERTLFKVNVFSKGEDYKAYNEKIGSDIANWARAYYSRQEPRFITTYHGEESEKDLEGDTDQIQCHEATHQVQHFYTWDLTRKALGHELEWLSCGGRPLWSVEGFAEFFSAHAVVDGKYRWMQPLDGRLSDLWILNGIMNEKKWENWKLRELIDTWSMDQMGAYASSRERGGKDIGVANAVMGGLFYPKSWSLMYFLWYAEEGGKPKYRDRFIEYLKREYVVRVGRDPSGREYPLRVPASEFRRVIGISDEAKFAAFEAEWKAFEAKLVEAQRKPDWEEKKKKLLKQLRLGG